MIDSAGSSPVTSASGSQSVSIAQLAEMVNALAFYVFVTRVERVEHMTMNYPLTYDDWWPMYGYKHGNKDVRFFGPVL